MTAPHYPTPRGPVSALDVRLGDLATLSPADRVRLGRELGWWVGARGCSSARWCVRPAWRMTMDHDYHNGCASGDCGGGCPLCSLDVCKVCGLYEGSLTSECPGVPAYATHSDRIYRGEIDFRAGQWVKAVGPHAPGSARWVITNDLDTRRNACPR